MAEFDVDRALTHLRMWARNASQGHCAKFTRRAIEAGLGGRPMASTQHAKDYGHSLWAVGFQEYHGFDYRPGDVVVIQGWQSSRGSNRDGHMAMFDGMQWISDFYQGYKSDPYPGPGYRQHRPSFRIYRHPDAANANGVGMTASGQGLRGVGTP
jgi:hypothetical protein